MLTSVATVIAHYRRLLATLMIITGVVLLVPSSLVWWFAAAAVDPNLNSSSLDLPTAAKNNFPETNNLITVEIQGAVRKPGIYQLMAQSRVIDLLQRAEGLSSDVDQNWIAETLNQAEIVEDGQKFYIPRTLLNSNQTSVAKKAATKKTTTKK